MATAQVQVDFLPGNLEDLSGLWSLSHQKAEVLLHPQSPVFTHGQSVSTLLIPRSLLTSTSVSSWQ
jgi:hypothetical protein